MQRAVSQLGMHRPFCFPVLTVASAQIEVPTVSVSGQLVTQYPTSVSNALRGRPDLGYVRFVDNALMALTVGPTAGVKGATCRPARPMSAAGRSGRNEHRPRCLAHVSKWPMADEDGVAAFGGTSSLTAISVT